MLARVTLASRLALALAVAGCGHLGFDERDAPTAQDGRGGDTRGSATIDAAFALPSLVVTYTNSGTMQFSFSPTFGTGHLLALAFSLDTGGQVVSVVDNSLGNMFESANAYSSSSGGATEIWYAANSRGGNTSLIVTLNGSLSTALWLVELANMDPSAPLDTAAHGNGNVTTTATTVAVTTTTPNEVVMSVLNVNTASITGLAGAPFQTLAVQGGDDAAYAITSSPGSYAATWNVDGPSDTCSSTATFKPAVL